VFSYLTLVAILIVSQAMVVGSSASVKMGSKVSGPETSVRALIDEPQPTPPIKTEPAGPYPPIETAPDFRPPDLPTDTAIRSQSGFNSYTLPANDDGYTDNVPLGFTANFFQRTYTSLYVNNNGNVTFDSPQGTYTPYDLTSTQRVIIAPFFADVDTRGSGSGLTRYGRDTVDGRSAFGVNWFGVGYYSAHTDKLNTYQLVLIDRSDLGSGSFDVEFNYAQIQWETGDASGGSGGLGGYSARAGYSNGTGAPGTFYEIYGSAINGAFLDSNTSTGLIHHSVNSSTRGRYRFEVRNGSIVTPTPTRTDTPTPTTTPTTVPIDAAALASQSEYLTVAPGAAISPWIEVRNIGTTTWTPAQYSYNGRGALQGWTGYLARNVAPGGTYRFFWNLNAPTTPGVYDYGFMLRHGTQEFGPYFFVRVTVILTPDTGFRANPNGFDSANRQLYRSWDMFRQFFGAANVQKADGTPCAVAQAYFNDNYRAVAGGWSCVGFATTSMISYLNLAQQNAGPYAMAAYPRLYEQPWSSTLSQPIAFYSGTQLTSQYAQAVAGWHQACDQEPFGLVERIRQSLVARDPLLLSIPARIGAQTYYHMVSPYNLVDISETEAHVYVYDSEAPGNNGKIMRFTRNASGWQWQYTFAGSLVAGGTNTGSCQATHAVRLSTLLQQGQPTVNWCSSTAALQISATDSAGNAMQSKESEVGSGRMMVFLPGDGDGFIRDTSGRRLGQINGQPVSEIPDALLVPQASAPGMQTSRSYYLPAGQYTLQTSGQGAGLVDSAVFGDGRLVAVEGQLEGSAAALLGVPSNLASANVNDPSAYASFAVTLIEDQPTASQTALVSVTQPTGSEPLALSSHGNQVLLSRAGGNLIYSLAYRDRGALAYISAAIAMGANEAHTLIRNSSTVTLQIDLGRNGTIDETRTLTNQVRRVYVPSVMR